MLSNLIYNFPLAVACTVLQTSCVLGGLQVLKLGCCKRMKILYPDEICTIDRHCPYHLTDVNVHELIDRTIELPTL